ncbi:CHAP domain-containing protein [bacterium]|nr:CHAP domain-containing protein [candidate division CSSED10-310 bacterium]
MKNPRSIAALLMVAAIPALVRLTQAGVIPLLDNADRAPSDIETQFIQTDATGVESFTARRGERAPMVGENYLRIQVGRRLGAGSQDPRLMLDFGSEHHVILWTDNEPPFPPGSIITWDLNEILPFLEAIPQDAWDMATLRATGDDDLSIERVVLVHSSQTIVNWEADAWLGTRGQSRLGLGADMLAAKLRTYDFPDSVVVHAGLLELGKTDGVKYGTTSAWCSEFASWCLHHAGWDTPTGSIGTSHLRSYFAARDRLYTLADIYAGYYLPRPGDYLSVFNDGHSAIFAGWPDGEPSQLSPQTKLFTVEGNAGGAVLALTRTLGQISHVGNAQ